jgi:hypothetical protein
VCARAHVCVCVCVCVCEREREREREWLRRRPTCLHSTYCNVACVQARFDVPHACTGPG